MTTQDEIRTMLAVRGASLLYCNGRLFVCPKSALDDALMAFLRENRQEVEEYAFLHAGTLTEAVRRVFASVLSEDQKIEDHLPSTLMLPCWGRFQNCRAFTLNQMRGMTASQIGKKVKDGQGCGDCDLFHARDRIARMDAQRIETLQRQLAAELANGYARSQEEEEESRADDGDASV